LLAQLQTTLAVGSDTARQLTELIEPLGRQDEPVSTAAAGRVEAGRRLVDHLFERALQLGLLLIAAAFIAALGFRALANRGAPSYRDVDRQNATV